MSCLHLLRLLYIPIGQCTGMLVQMATQSWRTAPSHDFLPSCPFTPLALSLSFSVEVVQHKWTGSDIHQNYWCLAWDAGTTFYHLVLKGCPGRNLAAWTCSSLYGASYYSSYVVLDLSCALGASRPSSRVRMKQGFPLLQELGEDAGPHEAVSSGPLCPGFLHKACREGGSPLRLLAILNCKNVCSETPCQPPRSSDEKSCQVQ